MVSDSTSDDLVFNPLKGLQPKQKEILKCISQQTQRFTVIRGSRQSGKSVLLQNIVMFYALSKVKQVGVLITPTHSQSKKHFDNLLARLPQGLISKSIASDSDRHIILTNGTKIQFKSSGNAESIRGNSYDFLCADEHSFINEDDWRTVIMPTVAAKKFAKICIVSTPLGRNLFYDYYTCGTDPNHNRYKSYDLFYTDNKFYDLEEVENARLSLPDCIFQQEYLAKFIFGSSSVFGDFSKHQTIKQFDFKPLPNRTYYFGQDWAGDGEDDSITVIMDDTGKVAYIFKPTDNNMVNQSNEVIEIIKRFKAKGYSETNGLGKGATDMLLNNISVSSDVFKFITSNESKQELVKELIFSMNENIIQLPIAKLCSKLDNQLATFEANRTMSGKINYSHAKGLHDDYVDALLLANHARVKLGNGTGISTMTYEDYMSNDPDIEQLYQDHIDNENKEYYNTSSIYYD